MSYTDITTTVGFPFPDTFYIEGAFIGNYYQSISIDTLNKRWYIKLSGVYYKLITWHFFSATGGTANIFFWILNSTGEANFAGRSLTYSGGDLTFAEAPTVSEYIPPDTVLSAGGSITFGVASSDYNITTIGNETYNFLTAPQIFVRPIVTANTITFTVNSNSSVLSSLNIVLSGPGGGDFNFLPPPSYWYRYTISGLTSGCNYASSAYYYDSNNVSSQSATFRAVYAGNKPSVVQNLNGTISGTDVILDWNTPVSDGGAPLLGYMIRDLTQTSNYNVPPFISTYTAPLLIPGSNLFSLEAVNDPGYSPRVYWSTVTV
jgi:hypothetical protein